MPVANRRDNRLVSREERRPSADLLPFSVRRRIPDFTLPLQGRAEGVSVPLNALLHDVYDRAGYALRLDYRAEPELPLEEADRAWAAPPCSRRWGCAIRRRRRE